MPDYNVGDIVQGQDGRSIRLIDRNGNLEWEDMGSPASFGGAAKAFGSGVLHEGVAGIAGLPGNISEAKNKAGAWLLNKLTDPAKRKSDFTPEEYSQLTGSLVTDPKAKLPTHEDIKGAINKVVPEYEPQNFLERGLKTSGSFAPALAMAPAAPAGAAGGLLAGLGRLGANAARYMGAPGFALEGTNNALEMAGQKDNPKVAIPAQLAATLLAPSAMGRLISPNPMTAAQRADAALLQSRGATFTPKQATGGALSTEAGQLGFLRGDAPIKAVNTQNTENYTRGALRTAFEDTLPHGAVRDEVLNATKVTPQLRQSINSTIDNEFNRLTGAYTMPLDATFLRDIRGAISHYRQEALLRRDPQLQRDVQLLERYAQQQNRPGLPAGHITGRQYQNLRSQLSEMSANETNTSAARALRTMRDALDDTMDRAIGFQNPNDLGAFQRVRQAHQNNMIFERALGAVGPDAAHHNMTPEMLSSAARRVLGADALGMENHAMSQYARAGQRILGKEIPDYNPTGLSHNFQLSSTLGGPGFLGALGGSGVETAATGHASPWGYALGALLATTPYASRPVVGALMRNEIPGGRRYLHNQVLPSEMHPLLLRDPSRAAIAAESLARRRPEPVEE